MWEIFEMRGLNFVTLLLYYFPICMRTLFKMKLLSETKLMKLPKILPLGINIWNEANYLPQKFEGMEVEQTILPNEYEWYCEQIAGHHPSVIKNGRRELGFFLIMKYFAVIWAAVKIAPMAVKSLHVLFSFFFISFSFCMFYHFIISIIVLPPMILSSLII